ncbi:MAG TPA: phosphoglycerate kinase [Caldisericia bacterium]|nr:phosphoglycerate kinase [Caldisericia bacterium]HPF48161.1 phosphoglycerate kinase [Caldisericia bacterium]HPI83903.1 phosphoglycerate kinase [Caldisericia bacterium]HPQ92614.1 phosphoglycerate kinase [Caldisericia bacterium]HRV74288.1 phosphoglycerate kinase [Caldisericia bacterium]
MKKSIESIDVTGKKVLLRADFNFPLEDGKITDDTRIRLTMPTIKYLLDKGAKLVICSHLGRPKGERVEKYSLKPVAKYLSEALGQGVELLPDCVGDCVNAKVNDLQSGQALMLENLRFHKEEENNDYWFAYQLSELAEVYVSDAFGTAHRAHASNFGVPAILKPAVAGYLLLSELKHLGSILEDPDRPFGIVFGGAKVSDKMGAIYNLLGKADVIAIGGGMSYTFHYAMGHKIGNSLVQPEYKESCIEFLEDARLRGKHINIPFDYICANDFENPTDVREVTGYIKDFEEIVDIPDGFQGMDIGTQTRKRFIESLSQCKTVLWNGPLGVFERDEFSEGTRSVMKAVSETVPVTIIGGGDSASAAAKFGLSKAFTHISTGGGASLAFLEGKKLPGIAVLDNE